MSEMSRFHHSAERLRTLWPRLHAGDAEPWPDEASVVEAWRLFHAGDYLGAAVAGLAAGGCGITVANKAHAMYAQYIERDESAKQALLLEVAERAHAQALAEPENANAHYWQAYAIGRYALGISFAKALALGLGTKIKHSLDAALTAQPDHADAYQALGLFHAEVIDKVGRLLARTQGADAAAGLQCFEQCARLNPDSPIQMVARANGLVMLKGEEALAEAETLYTDAAACEPLDATEQLEVEFARQELSVP